MHTAIEFLERRREKPFLLVVSFINPHDICLLAGEDSTLVPELEKRYFPPAGAELPPLPPNFANTAGEPAQLARRPRHEQWDESHWRKYIYAYYRLLEDVDGQVGRVLEALRQAGQEDNTLIIFTSDHGEGLAAHRWTGKMMFYDQEASVPLIVSWKGVTPPKRIDGRHLVSTLDVLPTICDYAGIQAPPAMRGGSLREVIEKPEQPGHEFVVSEMAGFGGHSSARFQRSARTATNCRAVSAQACSSPRSVRRSAGPVRHWPWARASWRCNWLVWNPFTRGFTGYRGYWSIRSVGAWVRSVR
jgi:arylsulfatase A-like enzyme